MARGANWRAVNEQAKRHADLLELERSSKTADDAFREADDAEQLGANLRAARDAGGPKPPVAM